MIKCLQRRGLNVETDVFSYFVAIGAGVSFGLSIGAVPALLVWRYVKRREQYRPKRA